MSPPHLSLIPSVSLFLDMPLELPSVSSPTSKLGCRLPLSSTQGEELTTCARLSKYDLDDWSTKAFSAHCLTFLLSNSDTGIHYTSCHALPSVSPMWDKCALAEGLTTLPIYFGFTLPLFCGNWVEAFRWWSKITPIFSLGSWNNNLKKRTKETII